jgi:DNA polymerase III alpha subunit
MKFINLHAHSGVGSPFDGFGFPQEHMDFAYDNGCEGLALTDHGNMNGFAYQVLHAKKMKQPERTSNQFSELKLTLYHQFLSGKKSLRN